MFCAKDVVTFFISMRVYSTYNVIRGNDISLKVKS